MSDKPIEGKEYLIKLKPAFGGGSSLVCAWLEDENAFDDSAGNGIYLHEIDKFIPLDLALHSEEMLEILKIIYEKGNPIMPPVWDRIVNSINKIEGSHEL